MSFPSAAPRRVWPTLVVCTLAFASWLLLSTPNGTTTGYFTDQLRNMGGALTFVEKGHSVFRTPYGEAAQGVVMPCAEHTGLWEELPAAYPPWGLLLFWPFAAMERAGLLTPATNHRAEVGFFVLDRPGGLCRGEAGHTRRSVARPRGAAALLRAAHLWSRGERLLRRGLRVGRAPGPLDASAGSLGCQRALLLLVGRAALPSPRLCPGRAVGPGEAVAGGALASPRLGPGRGRDHRPARQRPPRSSSIPMPSPSTTPCGARASARCLPPALAGGGGGSHGGA